MHAPRILFALLTCFLVPFANGESTDTAKLASEHLAAATPDKENFHIYLLMGQSNMAGRGVLDATTPANDPRVLTFDANGHWVVARDPIHVKIGRTEPGVGPGISFATTMLKTEDSKVTIGLVPCAVGGSPLRRWVQKGDLYAAALARARAASETGTLMGVLWHQGESDSDKQDTAESYEARLSKMFADLRHDLGRPDLPIVVGQLGEFLTKEKHPYVDVVRTALEDIPTKVAHTAFVDSADLHHKGDTLHFDTAGARELGVRFANAMRKLMEPAQTIPAASF